MLPSLYVYDHYSSQLQWYDSCELMKSSAGKESYGSTEDCNAIITYIVVVCMQRNQYSGHPTNIPQV